MQKNSVPVRPLFYRFDLKPQAQERMRTRTFDSGKVVRYMPSSKYQLEINRLAQEQNALFEPFTGDLACIMSFRLPHRRHGDLDNLVKAVLDGMAPKYKDGRIELMGVFRSDKVIKKLHTEIFYEENCKPAIEVIIYKHNSRAWLARLCVSSVLAWERIYSWIISSNA